MVRDAPKMRGAALQLDAVIFLIVVAILSAMGVMYFSDYTDKAKVARCEAELSTLAAAINQYAYEMHESPGNDFEKLSKVGKYPNDEHGIEFGPWIHTNTPLDPWNEPYVLIINTDKKGYVVYSKGPKHEGSISTPQDIKAAGNKMLGVYIEKVEGKVKTIAYYGRFGEPMSN